MKMTKAYWRENVKYLVILLSIWFLVSYAAGILFKDVLNEIQLGGFKLGFWFCTTRCNLHLRDTHFLYT